MIRTFVPLVLLTLMPMGAPAAQAPGLEGMTNDLKTALECVELKEWLTHHVPTHLKKMCEPDTKLALRTCFAVLGATCIFLSNPEKTLESVAHASSGDIANACLITLLRMFFLTLVHEGAHAATAYLLNDSAPIVHIGSADAHSPYIKIVPHLRWNGMNPNAGHTTYKDPLVREHSEVLANREVHENLIALIKKYIEHFPTLNVQQILQLPELKQEMQLIMKDPHPSVKNRLKATAILAAGGLTALAANNCLKYLLDEPLMAVDYFDTVQLINLLLPIAGSDAGQIVGKVLNMPQSMITAQTATHLLLPFIGLTQIPYSDNVLEILGKTLLRYSVHI